jgi:hypothetical protein
MTCDELVRNGPGKSQFLKLPTCGSAAADTLFNRDMDAAMEMFILAKALGSPPARLNQFLQPGLDECLPHRKPVLGLKELHQGARSFLSRRPFAKYTCCLVNGSMPV